jgi:sugar O-acyltransferase (sialic acid O-acetyltransferase NeuD family)
MEKTRKLVLFGDSAFAEIAREYFDHDSPYEVVAFTVTSDYLREPVKDGLPVVPFEQVAELYPPDEHDLHVALVYNQLNRPRMQFYAAAKALGYTLANYVSSRAFVWRNVTMGDNVFIFEDNTVQPFVTLGSNLVLWSGNHIGHHSTLRDHSFISSHVVISGFCDIGPSCFFGVNSTVGNNVTVGADCLVGSGALVVRDVPAGSLLKGPMTRPEEISTWEKLGIAINGDALRHAS